MWCIIIINWTIRYFESLEIILGNNNVCFINIRSEQSNNTLLSYYDFLWNRHYIKIIQILSTSKRLWTHCKMHNFWCLYMQHYNVIVSLYRSLAYTSTQSNKYLNDLNMICWLHAIVYSKCILFWILRDLLRNCLLQIF